MDIETALLMLSIVATGLMSGLWYGWTVSVIPGTRRIANANYVATMQAINQAIINPAFILPFLGIPALLAAAAFVHVRAGDSRRGLLLAGAAGTYLIGVLGVTVGGNVPLNDALEAFELTDSTADDVANRRRTYETRWNRWHYVRTGANVVAFALASAAAAVTAAGE